MDSGGLAILDLALIAVVLLSGLLALLRGFVHEVLSFGAWIGAALVALYAFPYAQPYARDLISIQVVADVGAGVVIFLITLVIFSLLAKAISAGVHKSGLSALDRTLGLVFGLVRGAVLVSLAWLIFAWLVPESDHPGWVKEARALPLVKDGAQILRDLVPESFVESLGESARRGLQDLEPVLPTGDPALQPAPKGSSDSGEPAYNEGERQQLEEAIEGLQGGAKGTGQ